MYLWWYAMFVQRLCLNQAPLFLVICPNNKGAAVFWPFLYKSHIWSFNRTFNRFWCLDLTLGFFAMFLIKRFLLSRLAADLNELNFLMIYLTVEWWVSSNLAFYEETVGSLRSLLICSLFGWCWHAFIKVATFIQSSAVQVHLICCFWLNITMLIGIKAVSVNFMVWHIFW